ncbi:hypothetical protein [Spartinivicinus ruber]|uniref:hypothetical protein n=1 Tax=Spartinivicinus ruber TaxID=2683272 RepID=UPI0013D63FA1|nr:hypothetical protein [Spartinivicinus ruber]
MKASTSSLMQSGTVCSGASVDATRQPTASVARNAQQIAPAQDLASCPSQQTTSVTDTLSKHRGITVSDGGKQIIINNVYLGDKPLGALDKFNIYSWRALGHQVNIYTHPFTEEMKHTPASLGLQQGDANIISLKDTLDADNLVTDNNSPKKKLSDTRELLQRWLKAIPADGKPERDHIFNMVDLTKSYLGGSQRGVTVDLKVGPSPHLQAYSTAFNEKLISYTRGGNTSELPENQSMGTMGESDSLRSKYAEKFNAKVKMADLVNQDHNAKHYDSLTGYHGRSYQQSGNWLDVATKTPLKEQIGADQYKVSEPGSTGHGPFRVFKHPSDQTNKSGAIRTSPEQIYQLANETLNKELKPAVGADQSFLNKAEKAVNELNPKNKV